MKALLRVGFVRSVKILYNSFEICLNLLEFASKKVKNLLTFVSGSGRPVLSLTACRAAPLLGVKIATEKKC